MKGSKTNKVQFENKKKYAASCGLVENDKCDLKHMPHTSASPVIVYQSSLKKMKH